MVSHIACLYSAPTFCYLFIFSFTYLVKSTASFLIIIFAVAQTVAEDYLVVIISAAFRNVVNAVVANDLRISMQRVGQFAYVCPEYSSDFAYAPSPGMPKAQHGVKLD